jgi:PAS domain S-box-containing protein
VSLTAKSYIAIVATLGVVAFAHGLSLWNPHDLPRFCFFLLFAIPASCLKVTLPGVTGTMSVLFLFLLAAVVELGIAETLVIGVTGVVVQCFWHARLRPRPSQIVFSVADIVLAITAAYYAYRASLPFLYVKIPLRLAIAASVFFVFNTVPIALVIALTEKKPIRQVWRECYRWSYAHYLVGAAMVGLFMFVNRALDWQVWILILPVVYVIHRSYRLYLDRLQSERKRTEQAHMHSEEVAELHVQTVEALASAMVANAKLDAVIQASPLATLALDRDGKVTSWNPTAERIFGWSAEEAIGSRPPFATGRSEGFIQDVIDRSLRGELITSLECPQQRKDGTSFSAAIWTAGLEDRAEGVSGILVMVADVSDRKQLEEQLRLSQKMEAVGQLAGGIAHDFNNLLTAILGYNEMVMEDVGNLPNVLGNAGEVQRAAERAASLTKQLLAFSRRQVLQPLVIDLNEVVRNMERLLRRVIGEDIDFAVRLEPALARVQADPSHIDQVIMNLVVNARDALPMGGKLTVETANVNLDEEYAQVHAGISPGSYVQLAVSDTGQGMNEETQRRIFEPFFTTKELGKGTGLGLSIVYGIVKQSGGDIGVYSQEGKGTTFKIYLPAITRDTAVESTERPAAASHGGAEVILLVEDEPHVRRLVRAMLAKQGYNVLETREVHEAIQICNDHHDPIHLLLTDVVMPERSGPELAEELARIHPEMRVLFMSGYADTPIFRHGVLRPNTAFIQKPFISEDLNKKVREVLEG